MIRNSDATKSNSVVFILPTTHRPLKTSLFTCWGKNNATRIDVRVNGEVKVVTNGSNVWQDITVSISKH